MSLVLFVLAVSIALIGPLLAVHYLRPILVRVLALLCGQGSTPASEFWVRSAYLLAISGTMILMLLWGDFGVDSSPVEMLRHNLLLVFIGVFLSISLIARTVWKQVARQVLPITARPEAATPAAQAMVAEH